MEKFTDSPLDKFTDKSAEPAGKFSHLESGHPVMTDVSAKAATSRDALAEGFVTLTDAIVRALAGGTTEKGDVLKIAELAGIMGAKQTPKLIPLCHTIRLDSVRVECGLDAGRQRVDIRAFARASEVTGVEMEALTAVSIAALTVYDMCKGIDKGMVIGGVRLLRKSGGKSGEYRHDSHNEHNSDAPPRPPLLRAGVLTISDKGARGEREDTAGPALCELLATAGAEVVRKTIVPDERAAILAAVRKWAGEGIPLILTTGGTGLSPRDVTPDALMEIADRVVPGLGERMRSESLKHTPNAPLSRSLAVTFRSSLIVALPGSEKGARQCFEAIRPSLFHAIGILSGQDAECAHRHDEP